MKKLIAIILSTICLGRALGMDVPSAIHTENPTITATITREQIIQTWEVLGDRDDFWNIKHNCEADMSRSRMETTSSEESLELLKKAFCGPAEIGLRAYIDQEEKRFIEILDQNLDKSLNLLREVCSQQDIDFGFVLNLGICKDSASSLGYKFLQFEDIQKKKQAMFWLLVAATGYNTSMPSHCIISAGDLLNRLRGI